MGSAELLTDAFGRVREIIREVVEGLDAEALAERLDADANSIGWLVWHLTRVQDDHIADVAGREQRWTADGWFERFGLPFPPGDIGYGHSSADVAAVRASDPDLLVGYHEAVHAQTVDYLAGITDPDLDVVVDESWDPPTTLGVRLVSVVGDTMQHAGQAEFVRGILLRR
ncbi:MULTISPECIES: mycothiol transferase [Prauserella salsuginis group]|uniref:DinB family protein n=1 Tax=Prauserella salsuginis TaxID=387889 RepID=A0ABW6G742_9PSEU|nr:MULTISPECIES: DinB family protein [Prauserella salsuginis group]MCR3720787.1 Protein of unknown function (DUF664) [Prauserella flava]MCR3735132.1 Protein of unknown function (DUF664) [Prauserella salsuginis]